MSFMFALKYVFVAKIRKMQKKKNHKSKAIHTRERPYIQEKNHEHCGKKGFSEKGFHGQLIFSEMARNIRSFHIP